MCHITRPGKDFATQADFERIAQTAYGRICTDYTMPNAKVTYQRFWLTRLPTPLNNPISVLRASGIAPFPTADCPPPPSP